MKHPIEKGVPIPLDRLRFPFAQMEVGDSFAFERNDHPAVREAASRHAKKHGRKYLTSLRDLRCWRTA